MSADPERVRELFERARALDAAARERALADAAADERSEVEALLAEHDRAGDFLAAPVLGDTLFAAMLDSDIAPQRFAGYRIVGELGRGGMGVVYRAEQDSPRRAVALKVIAPGAASASNLRRFANEAQVLARLHHPGIAQIYEAGTATAAQGALPFFALELVDGEALTDFAERRGLATRERVALFVRVCEAVQHAHQMGVIHRDLKPSNVLVDASGQPKVLDFGVARLCDADVQLTTVHTDVGAIVGTLRYMSPEQLAADPGALDTRSDVYALGVVLYELLSGALPYELEGLSLADAARAIAESEPVALRARDPRLRGDLETVVTKAMAKEPGRRYASVSELARDLERWLAREPIAARPPSTLYVITKFAQRNRALAAALVLAFAALAAGTLATSLALRRALREEQLTAGQRDRAQREAAARGAIHEFLREVLASSDPRQLGRDVRLSDVLAGAAQKIDGAFEDQPEVEAALRATIGWSLYSVGEGPAAEPQLRRALELRDRGAFARDVLSAGNALALLLKDSDRPEEAEQVLRGALDLGDAALGADEEMAMLLEEHLALILRDLGRGEEARRTLQRTSAWFAEHQGPAGRDALVSRSNLASIELDLGRFADAERTFREVVAALGQNFPPEHPDVLLVRHQLALALMNQERFADAEPICREVVEGLSHAFEPGHPNLLSARSNWSHTLRELGRLDESESALREVLEAAQSAQGESGPATRAAMRELSLVLAMQGEFDEADALSVRSLELAREQDGPSAVPTLRALDERAVLLARAGRFDEAELPHREALEAAETSLAPTDEQRIVIGCSYASFLVQRGRFAEAEARVAECYERRREFYGEQHPRTRRALDAVNRVRAALRGDELATPAGGE